MNAPQHARAAHRSVGAIVGGLIAVVLGSALAWLGSREAVNELALRANHLEADAQLVDARVMQSRKLGTTYEVQYRFTVPGSTDAYTRRDETGRTDLWTSLEDEATWQEARREQRVKVIYRADDPWVNRPEKAGAMPLGDTLAAAILGALIALPGLAVVILQLRGPRLTGRSSTPT